MIETQQQPPITSNKIALDDALVEEFKAYQKNIRENTVAMAEKAYEIRSQYLSADGRKYDPEFEKWWKAHNLTLVFGNRSNFTKWASAGKALATATFEKYSDRVPTTLTALYEISQLTPDEVKRCLEDRYTRASPTDEPKGRKKPSPLIHPEVTASEIKTWRTKWRNPPVKSSTEKRRLPFATIKVHGSLYDFTKEGKHGGVLTPDKLKEINDTLLNALRPFDEFVLVETTLTELLEGHEKRRQAAEDRAAKLLGRWISRVHDYIRKNARRVVHETKRKVKAQNRQWGFKSDETDIPWDADFQRVQDVLDTIGRGDEFKALIEKAYTEVILPKTLSKMADAENTEALEEVARQLEKARKKSKIDRSRFRDFK